jgi:Na+/proline symporter
MISQYDYLSIFFYFVFVFTVGVVFSRRNKNTSDYFRGGGIMPWWMAGVSAWMMSFSAWTFTGTAGKIYDTGPYALLLYFASIATYVIMLVFTCYRFRRMRTVTPMEAIRARYGAATQQFVTWIRLPILLLFGGVGLNSVGVFMSGAFGIKLRYVIAALGGMVTFVSLVGGAFGVAASDFVQMFLVVTVTVVISVFALYSPQVGGFSGMLAKMPAADFHWSQFARPQFILLWFLGLMFCNIFLLNTIEMSAKYLMARSDAHARKMVLFPLLGTIIGPLLWLLPPMVASVAHPGGLAAFFPTLKHPEEGAFLLMAHDVLPKGMMGLLIAGIFGATLSNLDASMNQAVGILVRNFYLPVINPNCPEKRLLIVSKLCTATFGVLIIFIGLEVDHFRTAKLFDLLNQLGVGLWLPLAVPMCLGLFFKRTPPWSSWSTILIGYAAAFFVNFLTTPEWAGWIPGLHGPYVAEERTQYYIFATVACVLTTSMSWFFFSSLFYDKSPVQYKANVEEFFARLKRPIEDMTMEQVRENTRVVGAIGWLCVIFGGFDMLMMLVPNEGVKRLAFLFSGGSIFCVGWLLQRVSRRKQGQTSPAGPAKLPAASKL